MNKGTLKLKDIVNTSALEYTKDLSDPEAPKHTYVYTVADNWKPELAYPFESVYKVYNSQGMERCLAFIRGGKK